MPSRAPLAVPILLLLLAGTSPAQDTDHDGLPDTLEQQLLEQFAPAFQVSRGDCSAVPAQFVPGQPNPTVASEDGTIYGQAFPRAGHPDEVELHFYHLWRRDCGELGHALDTEHVSALVTVGKAPAQARALLWYAAAHEGTMCDASQLTRASTLHAEDRGATVWISSGKHASFLAEPLCSHSCGGDQCHAMEPLHMRAVVNLGEWGAPMHGIAWLGAPAWPLAEKMRRSDFSDARVARLNRLPASDVAWAEPSKRPEQAAILGVHRGLDGAATGARATDTALALSGANTGSALGTATEQTGDALGKSSRNVWSALKKSARKTGEFLDGGGKGH